MILVLGQCSGLQSIAGVLFALVAAESLVGMFCQSKIRSEQTEKCPLEERLCGQMESLLTWVADLSCITCLHVYIPHIKEVGVYLFNC
jgi:hypothetical protein